MKIDQWTAFVEMISSDPAAVAIVRGGDVQKILEMARSKGFTFTEQDLLDTRTSQESGELSDSVLEGVSGAYGAGSLHFG